MSSQQAVTLLVLLLTPFFTKTGHSVCNTWSSWSQSTSCQWTSQCTCEYANTRRCLNGNYNSADTCYTENENVKSVNQPCPCSFGLTHEWSSWSSWTTEISTDCRTSNKKTRTCTTSTTSNWYCITEITQNYEWKNTTKVCLDDFAIDKNGKYVLIGVGVLFFIIIVSTICCCYSARKKRAAAARRRAQSTRRQQEQRQQQQQNITVGLSNVVVNLPTVQDRVPLPALPPTDTNTHLRPVAAAQPPCNPTYAQPSAPQPVEFQPGIGFEDLPPSYESVYKLPPSKF